MIGKAFSSEENTKVVPGLLLDKELMGLQKQKHCHLELKGTEMGQNEGRLSDFLDLTGQFVTGNEDW